MVNSDQRLLAMQDVLGVPVSPVWLHALWEAVSPPWRTQGTQGTRHEDSRGGLRIDPKSVTPDLVTHRGLLAEARALFPDMVDQRRDVGPYAMTIVPGIDNPNVLRHLVTVLYRQCSDAGVEVASHVPASLRPLLDYALECADQAGTTTSQ